MEVVVGDDGVARCWWGAEPEIYRTYHDDEWGHPTTSDHRLFEKVCLEGFQAGLSWLTVLRKRESFREAFADFNPEVVATFGETEVESMLGNASIIRHEGKIRSTINNARRALELVEERGTLADYFWSWAEPDSPPPKVIPAKTETSTALSKDLKKRGWSFIGPTTIYAFMQSEGLVNDHLAGCDARDVSGRHRLGRQT